MLFYNHSKFDGTTTGVSTSDDAAIAVDKLAYLPGAGTATFANLSGYVDGINGIMVDLSPGTSHAGITAADFTLRVGTNNSPSTWAAARAGRRLGPPPPASAVPTGSN